MDTHDKNENESASTSRTELSISVSISFRGNNLELPIHPGTSVGDAKSQVASTVDDNLHMTAADIKFIYKGKVISDDTLDLYHLLKLAPRKNKYKLLAMGQSTSETELFDNKKRNGPHVRIRDDLSDVGKANLETRRRIGVRVLANASKSSSITDITKDSFGFGRIETLPMLPNQDKARDILKSLMNDRGVKACMTKHKWKVGCLAELYPEGKVGESDVCIMGLNQNKGQKILLRLRTDDLQGFRKILSIRKVLFHELAHNVHSKHDGAFFQLMRQIEKECTELDWTRSGEGKVIGGCDMFQREHCHHQSYDGGTYILGGLTMDQANTSNISPRELSARAAERRMTAEEEEIENACGCNLEK